MGAPNGLQSPLEPVRRLRQAVRRANRDLALIEEAQQTTDRFGTYRLAPGEPIDDELLDYLRRARREHPQQVLTIAVTARAAADTPSANGAQRKEQHP